MEIWHKFRLKWSNVALLNYLLYLKSLTDSNTGIRCQCTVYPTEILHLQYLSETKIREIDSSNKYIMLWYAL